MPSSAGKERDLCEAVRKEAEASRRHRQRIGIVGNIGIIGIIGIFGIAERARSPPGSAEDVPRHRGTRRDGR